MRPTREQIEVAAYHRWQRRDWSHGGDHDDWAAAEKDLEFGLNYRYIVRHRLDAPGDGVAEGRPRRCRFCEHAAPSVAFANPAPPLLPAAFFGRDALRALDECDDCRRQYEADLARAFDEFAAPLLGPTPAVPPGEVPAAALKALVRVGLNVMPPGEMHHFGDTVEWVTNPDHGRDAATLRGLGCHVYLTPSPVPSPFLTLARRVDDDAPLPYMLVFLASDRVVFQTHLPFCPRDEDFEDLGLCGPELSLSLGSGPGLAASRCAFLPVAAHAPARRRTLVAAPG